MKTKSCSDVTTYSLKVEGDEGNGHCAVKFDNTGSADFLHEPGYIGIVQFDENGNLTDRVLLSPRQMQELIRFSKKMRGNYIVNSHMK